MLTLALVLSSLYRSFLFTLPIPRNFDHYSLGMVVH